ncbi:MAG: ankyrin repeat domain-containing protein [Synergistaceae bacterium]|nr:ankyrin repeat domain-containing protein [Synergistaceae bacterium]
MDLDSLADEELSALEAKYYSFLEGICGAEAVSDYCEFHCDWDFCREVVRYIEGESDLSEDELRVMVYAYVEDNDSLEELLDSKPGINVDFQTEDGLTAMTSALDSGNIDGMEILLEHGADPDMIIGGETLLLGMVRKQAKGAFVSYYEAIDLLLFHCADPDIPNSRGETCADFVSKDPKLAEIFAKHGLYTQERVNPLDRYDDNGMTPLMNCVIEAVNEGGLPLNYDDWGGTRRLVEEFGVNVNAVSDDGEGKTALMYTLSDRDDRFSPEIASYLLEHGADPNIRDAEGMSFIDDLCLGTFNEARLEVLKLAVSRGADINSPGPDGMTPLMRCVVGAKSREDDRNFEAVKFLVESGADVNARRNNENRFTVLMFAAMCRCEYAGDIIEYLVEHGADTQVAIKNGWKAVNFLKIRSNPSKERVRSLLQQQEE